MRRHVLDCIGNNVSDECVKDGFQEDEGRSFLPKLCNSQITRRHIWQNNNLHCHHHDYQKAHAPESDQFCVPQLKWRDIYYVRKLLRRFVQPWQQSEIR